MPCNRTVVTSCLSVKSSPVEFRSHRKYECAHFNTSMQSTAFQYISPIAVQFLCLYVGNVTVLAMETKEEDPDADTGLEPDGNSKGFIVI